MSENQLEQKFIENCGKMSFEELGNYIETSLNTLFKNKEDTEDVPLCLETYDFLLKLLEDKIKDELNSGIGKRRYIESFIEKSEKTKSESSEKITTYLNAIKYLLLAEAKFKKRSPLSDEIHIENIIQVALDLKKELIHQRIISERKLKRILETLKYRNFRSIYRIKKFNCPPEHIRLTQLLDEIEQLLVKKIKGGTKRRVFFSSKCKFLFQISGH